MKQTGVAPTEIIERKIYLIRGMKVMLSYDLAKLYQVETRALVQAVQRNIDRFPSDFMFQISKEEFLNLKSQIVIPSWGGIRRSLPYAFTEQGVAMLASVLKSKRAVQMSIAIVRAFIKLRELLATNKDVLIEIEKIKQTQEIHGQHIANIIGVIKKLIDPPPDKTPKEPIGFRDRDKDKK